MRVGSTLDQILAGYPKDVRVVYKMHPLSMHQNAMIAAEAALAANAQGKFREMDQKLLESSASLSRDKILALAASIGLDVKRFTNDLDTHAFKADIEADIKEAMSVGASGTPASFVNGRFISGAAPLANFKSIIDAELAKTAK